MNKLLSNSKLLVESSIHLRSCRFNCANNKVASLQRCQSRQGGGGARENDKVFVLLWEAPWERREALRRINFVGIKEEMREVEPRES
ncbi:hypothetical protein AXF42_Ash020340 [Apostasia shenzhenica]|uniref:Uncharacterized protein n=1 Tax=Apostasia shenzhenica TaxID=1088818 RepID=A0A2I0B0Q7_9ASPA|nr:hypothetical protein AXF42_Ash020340 [Apostasia shenzhenica]